MTDTDSLTAAVKEAINEAGHDWLRNQPDGWSGWADIPDEVFAKAAIAAVRRWEAENGWRCMPEVADDDMDAAGEQAWMHRDLDDDDSDPIRDCYRAMVSASPPPPGSVKE